MATVTIGANLAYGNASFLWADFFRKCGIKARILTANNPVNRYDTGDDAGATFPRQIGICYQVNSTAPVTNNAGDNPSGKGDLCIVYAINNFVGASKATKIPVASITIYRCTAYTNSTTFTWAQIL